MTPLDLIWAATKAHTLWPGAEVHGNSVGNLKVVVGEEYVGWIDCVDGSVNDVVTDESYKLERD